MAEFVEWNAKKGRWESYTNNENGMKVTLGFQTAGNKIPNEQVLYRYVDYLESAIENRGTAKDLNIETFNLKNFISAELGNHYSTFQVKTILKGFNESQVEGKTIYMLPVGPRGAASNAREYRERVSKWIAEKHSDLLGKDF